MRVAPTLFLSGLLISCSAEPYAEEVTTAAVPPEKGVPTIQYKDPDCESDLAGKFIEGPGNRHVRYGHMCSQRISINFTATPEFNLNYSITAYDCDQKTNQDWSSSAEFFKKPLPRQIEVVQEEITTDLRALAAVCGTQVDSAPFVGPSFSKFYHNYGDGWWFSRLESGIILTPEKGSEYRNAQTH